MAGSTGTDSPRSDSLAARIAAFVAGAGRDLVPSPVIERSKDLVLDTLGAAYAALGDPLADSLLKGGFSLGSGGRSTVIGQAACLTSRDAALINGALMHGLDFDDTHLKSMVHSSVVALPTALAVAEDLDLPGRELLVAFGLASEAAIRLGLATRGMFPDAGFHATAIIGHFASALAAGRLMGLTRMELVAAQGIAGSTAAGILAYLNDGTWTKRLHPGWAAMGGITAAGFARAGFTGPAAVYEGRFGVFDAFLGSDAGKVERHHIGKELGERWHILDVSLKPYPVCHLNHGCTEAAVEIAIREDIRAEDVVGITALLPREALPLVAEPLHQKQRPETSYEARFSAPYAVATGLARRRFGMADLTAEALADADVRALSAKVACEPDPDTAFPEFCSGGVVVRMRDGRALANHVRVNAGSGERSFARSDIEEKFRDSVSSELNAGQADRIIDAVMSLESMSARELGAILRAAAS